ncbi:hypothetical protein [Aquimarina sp. I32.4]|uniref:hypothetical protein n=1 Tax=Aquimarina sp. I32.4 TaxID=2053903 RepID=UPI001304AAA3|nr:hypothetical protein [Aquimarina sp. I32.4]
MLSAPLKKKEIQKEGVTGINIDLQCDSIPPVAFIEVYIVPEAKGKTGVIFY